MNGHKLFAEVIAQTVSGRRISLADVLPPGDRLHFTLQRLRASQPVKVVAMPPYDTIVPAALRKLFPNAQIEITPWPTEGRTLAQLEQWAKSLRGQPPHLVVVAVPATAKANDEDTFLQSYAWVLNYSIAFGQLAWDRVVILPTVTGPLAADQKRWQDLARRLPTVSSGHGRTTRQANLPLRRRPPTQHQNPCRRKHAHWSSRRFEQCDGRFPVAGLLRL
jgi:hypothetical protein